MGRVPCGAPPARFDPEAPSAARVWNYLLGGRNYGEADEAAARTLLGICPTAARMAQVTRLFATRAACYAASMGVSQFIDLGCGLPPAPWLHQTAGSVLPGVTVAYVDLDEMVAAELDALIGGDSGVAVVRADLRDPAAVLADPGLSKVIDPGRPVCVLATSVLHPVPAGEAARITAGYAERVAAGSYLAVAAPRIGDPGMLAAMNGALGPEPLHDFTPGEFAALFDGLELAPPGIVPAIRMQPGWADTCRVPPPGAYTVAGVGRKP